MSSRESLPDAALVAFATTGFLALLVAGLGVGSLVADEDIVTVPGISVVSAYLAAGIAIGVFALTLSGTLRRPRPSYVAVVGIALATTATHAVAFGAIALIDSGSPGTAVSAIADVLLGWVDLVFAGAALLAGWFAIAVRRTAARPPRWRWERDADDE